MGRVRGRGRRRGGGGKGRGSPSHSAIHSDSSNDPNITNAAASRGFLSNFDRWRFRGGGTSDNTPQVRHCKDLVRFFELCAINHRTGEGKSAPVCQIFEKRLEKYCAEYKSSWSEWWTNELKINRCESLLFMFGVCVSERGKEYPPCKSIQKELQEICSGVFDQGELGSCFSSVYGSSYPQDDH